MFFLLHTDPPLDKFTSGFLLVAFWVILDECNIKIFVRVILH